jgi:broad specificity phosphatase PhoE
MLVRHGEPALSRKVRLSAAEYRHWWNVLYEEGGIREGQVPPPSLIDMAASADVIYASTRRRAVETAEAVTGGRAFAREVSLIEAPLPPPPLPGFVKLNPRTWGFISRVAWWFFGHHEGQETRRQAEGRARDVAKRLAAEADAGRKVLVLAHGFFNTMIGRELKRLGWYRAEGRGYRYWSAHLFKR